MNRFALLTACALALAACGGDEAPEDAATDPAEAAASPAPPTPEAPSGPPPVEGYDWAMHGPTAEEPDLAFLAYAVPETDDVPFSLNCRRGSGIVRASTDSGTPGVGAFILGSGQAQAMYPVTERVPSELSGGEFLTAEIPLADGPLQAFRMSGWINLSVAGEARDLAAHPGPGRDAIERFFSFCAPVPASEAAPG